MSKTIIKLKEVFNILIVDDAIAIHPITSNVFYGENILNRTLHFISKYNEEEAIEFLKIHHNEISVIILDIVMKSPEGGLYVIDYLRNRLHNSITQIIIRTGYSNEYPMREIINSYNINGYLEKGNTTSDELYSVIRGALITYSELQNLTDLTFALRKEIKVLSSYEQQKINSIIENHLPSTNKALLFIHGLAGTNDRWDQMISVIKDDKDFYIPFDIKEYSYPTTLYNWKPFSKYPSIPTITDGLKTYVKNNLSNYSTIVIVAHSMGGLATRRLLIEEVQDPSLNQIIQVIFYSTPNKGSIWASLTFIIQLGNAVIPQMRRRSKFIKDLNISWISLGIKDKYRMRYVNAGRDIFVGTSSPEGLFNRKDIETIVDKTHTSIGKPKDSNELSYTVLKRFALGLD